MLPLRISGALVIGALAIGAADAASGAPVLHRAIAITPTPTATPTAIPTTSAATAAGSEGALTILQKNARASAIQGDVGPSADTSLAIPFGVLGEFAPGNGFGIGVAGISQSGYGVAAEAFGGAPALLALSKGTGDAIEAYASGGYQQSNSSTTPQLAIFAENDGTNSSIVGVNTMFLHCDENHGPQPGNCTSPAIYGFSQQGPGVGGFSGGSGTAGVTGKATDPDSSGVLGTGSIGVASLGTLLANGRETSMPAFIAQGGDPGPDLFEAQVPGPGVGSDLYPTEYTTLRVTYPSANKSGLIDNSRDLSSDVLLDGDIYVSGNVYADCSGVPGSSTASPAPAPPSCADAQVAETQTQRGFAVRTYADRQSAPALEDEGKGQLVNGSAHIALEPDFAAAISPSQPYYVFTTPRGDSRGLYVTNASPSGFDVRENGGGRTTVAFDYRIVATPYADASPRLPHLAPHRGPKAAAPAAQTRKIASALAAANSTRHWFAGKHAKALDLKSR